MTDARSWLLSAALLVVGCTDPGGAGAEPDPGPTRAQESDARPPVDAAPDASAPDEGADPCLEASGIAPGLLGQTDREGRLALYDPASGGYFVALVRDATDAPLPDARVAVAVGPRQWTALVSADGRAAVAAVGERGPAAVGVDAATQLLDGIGAVEGRAAVERSPECLEGAWTVELHARLLRAEVAAARLVKAQWDGRCPGAEWGPACAVLEGLAGRLTPGGPGGLLLGGDTAPTFGAERGLRGLDVDWEGTRDASCRGRLGHGLVSWLPEAESGPVADRLLDVYQRLQVLLIRLSREVPGDQEAAADEVGALLAAFARVAWMARSRAVDVHPEDRGEAFFAGSAFLAAVEAVRGYARGRALGVELEAPYHDLLLGDAPSVDGLGWRASEGPASSWGLGDGAACGVLAVVDLKASAGRSIGVARAVGHMLELLAAGAAEAEATFWPDTPDGVAPDAAVDAGTPEPDAAPEGPPCPDDEAEPNETWEALGEARRPPGGAVLEGLTLPPGDEDWFVFEAEHLHRVFVELSADDAGCGAPGPVVCVDMWLYTWGMAQGIIPGGPEHLLGGPACGDLRDRVAYREHPAVARRAQNEPWIAVLVRVYRDDDSPNHAAYTLELTEDAL